MRKLLQAIGNTFIGGTTLAVAADTGLRAGWRRNPRPMPRQFAALLDHPWRLKYRNPGETLGMYGFEAGMTVLDAGCGSGLFTAEMARMVGPSGTVHAVDVHDHCMELTSRRLKQAGLASRVQFHHCGLYALPLQEESVDLSVLISTIGEVPDPYLALAEIMRVTKAGGRVAMSEELPDPAYVPGRIVKSMMADVGFRFGGVSRSLLTYSMIFFKDS